MAWTTTKTFQHNEGNQVVQAWFLDADSATLELDTGLNVVNHISVAPGSMTSTVVHCSINKTSAGVASNGYVSVTGATSGDVLFLTVYGR